MCHGRGWKKEAIKTLVGCIALKDTVFFFLSCQQAGTGSVCDIYVVLKLSVWWLLMNHLIYEPSVCAKSLQLCLTLCDPMDCSLPDSSVRGILQARILEWIAIPFSRESSQPRDQTLVSCIVGRFFFFFLNLKWIVHLFYGSAMWRVKWFSVDCSVNMTGYVIWIKILGHSKCLHF